MSQVQAALFSLSGGGDCMIFLAPKSALDWCMDVSPGERFIPDAVINDLTPFLEAGANMEELRSGTYITTGSSDNDAALFLCAFCKSFDTNTKAVRFASKNDWTLDEENEYQGCIY